jgi:hypothetical protein
VIVARFRAAWPGFRVGCAGLVRRESTLQSSSVTDILNPREI